MSEESIVHVDIHKRENKDITVKKEEGQVDLAQIDRRHVHICISLLFVLNNKKNE